MKPPRNITTDEAIALAKKYAKKRKYDESRSLYEAVLMQEPNNSLAKKGLRKLAKTYSKSAKSSNRKPQTQPTTVEALIQHYQAGRFTEAQELGEILLKHEPNSSTIQNLLGAVLTAQGKLREAVESYKKAIAVNPEFAEAHSNCGVALKRLGQVEEAIDCYKRAVEIAPNYVAAYSNLGVLLQEAGRLNEALNCHNNAIELQPDSADAYYNRGIVFQELGNNAEAIQDHNKAISLNPNLAAAHCNLGLAAHELGDYGQALKSYRNAISLKPDMAEAFANLGTLLQDIGSLDDALESYLAAIMLDANYLDAYSNLLMLMNYIPKDTASNYLELAKKYGRIVKAKSKPLSTKIEEPTKRLRIGFVSGDLRNHPVGYLLEGLLLEIDTSKFELHAFPTTLRHDSLTERLQKHFSGWHPIYGIEDDKAAKLIADHNIHILVDLAGHTQNNRLPLFAFKPSPVQVSWLGYFATTGVDEIDYILGDPYVTPPGSEEAFTETIWRLPDTRWCYSPPSYSVEVAESPVAKNGYITFGCFNNLTKINHDVVAVWCEILLSIPNSKLILKSYQARNEEARSKLLELFKNSGLDSSRVLLEQPETHRSYFEAYGKIDIALDTFPFSGGMTSIEGLWMGVPLVTLSGNSLVSRQGVGILASVGLEEWIATDQKHYISKAVKFSTDIDALVRLRANLRQKALDSPLFDNKQFSMNFETALNDMWSMRASQSLNKKRAEGLTNNPSAPL